MVSCTLAKLFLSGANMNISDGLKSAGKAIGNTIESAVIPTRVQQWYMHYQLKEAALAETKIPPPFLAQLAELSNHIYLTGTTRNDSADDSKSAYALKYALGELFQNYYLLERFDAATGMIFNTRGPFGAMIASVALPNAETLKRNRTVSPLLYRYRLFFVFRGTSPGLTYWDDISTDLKFLKRDSTIGNKRGDICSGFLSTYESCKTEILHKLIPKGIAYLNAEYTKIKSAYGATAVPERAASHVTPLSVSDIELYVVGHSLGGAVATLCAYDIACLKPSLRPVLVTFGSPPVGNVDFAVDFQKVMVDSYPFHPKSGFMRSVRIVAKTTGKHADLVTSAPDIMPNVIHINTKVSLETQVSGWKSMLSAHSMKNSYEETLNK
jgi:hypothetical protein